MKVYQTQIHITEMGKTEVSKTKIGEMQGRNGFAIAPPPVPFGDPLPPASQEFDGFPEIHEETLHKADSNLDPSLSCEVGGERSFFPVHSSRL
jgi:hypothetical protein